MGKQLRNVESALKVGLLYRGAPHSMERVYDLCGLPSLQVLGMLNSTSTFEPSHINASTISGGRTPQISCQIAKTIQIIMFQRPQPNRMQYISLIPIALAIEDKAELMLDGMEAEDEKAEAKKREKQAHLVEKLKLHTVTKHRPTAKELALPKIVHQINFSSELQKLLQKNISLVGSRRRRTLSVSERVIETASTVKDNVLAAVWYALITYLYPLIRAGFVLMLMGHRSVAEVFLRVLEYRVKPDYAALKDISATEIGRASCRDRVF